jgi:hypothetical protein
MQSYLREVVTSAFSAGQRDALATRQTDQDRTVEALHQLDAALVAAATGRESVWRRNVADALEVLADAVAMESRAQALPDSMLSDLARTQPRLRNRVRGLRREFARLSRQIGDALRFLCDDEEVGIAETRTQLGGLIAALQLARGRESDLIYEAYYDAFNRDLEDELWGPGPRRAWRGSATTVPWPPRPATANSPPTRPTNPDPSAHH